MVATTSAGASDSKEQARSAIKGGKAKNVILLIGDGMGDSEMTLARDYTVGADGRLNLDKFPLTGAYTTYAVHADGTPDYVTDSAASGTGWATGHKTVNGRISKTPGTDKAPMRASSSSQLLHQHPGSVPGAHRHPGPHRRPGTRGVPRPRRDQPDRPVHHRPRGPAPALTAHANGAGRDPASTIDMRSKRVRGGIWTNTPRLTPITTELALALS